MHHACEPSFGAAARTERSFWGAIAREGLASGMLHRELDAGAHLAPDRLQRGDSMQQPPPGGQPPGHGQPPGQPGGFPQGGAQQGGFQQGGAQQGGFPPSGQQGGHAQGGHPPQQGFAGGPAGPPQPGFSGGPAGPSQPGYGTPSPFASSGGGSSTADRAKGFLKSLFDFSFESFISPRVLKIMYGFWLFMIVPMFLFLLMTWYQALTWESYDFTTGATESDPKFGLFCGATIAFPIIVFVWVLMGRVLFERGILAFRQHDVLRDVLDELRNKS